MKKLLIGGAALLASAAALAQVAPVTPAPAQRAERVQTRAEVQAKVTEHFARVDANHDGSITKVEADAAMQAFHAKFAEHAKDRRDDRRDNVFERLDTNRDGAVSRAEWDAGAAQRRSLWLRNRQASTMGQDSNGDGAQTEESGRQDEVSSRGRHRDLLQLRRRAAASLPWVMSRCLRRHVRQDLLRQPAGVLGEPRDYSGNTEGRQG